MVFYNLLNLKLPENLQVFLTAVRSIALGEFIDLTWLKDPIMEWISSSRDSILTEDQQQNSFIDQSFLILLALAVALCISPIVAGCVFIARRFCGRTLHALVVMIRQKIFWNFFIRYSTTSYLILTIQALMTLKASKWKVKSERFSAVLASITLIAAFLLPYFYYRILEKTKTNGKARFFELKPRIGSLYEGQRFLRKA